MEGGFLILPGLIMVCPFMHVCLTDWSHYSLPLNSVAPRGGSGMGQALTGLFAPPLVAAAARGDFMQAQSLAFRDNPWTQPLEGVEIVESAVRIVHRVSEREYRWCMGYTEMVI
jgi:hypothetical protein